MLWAHLDRVSCAQFATSALASKAKEAADTEHRALVKISDEARARLDATKTRRAKAYKESADAEKAAADVAATDAAARAAGVEQTNVDMAMLGAMCFKKLTGTWQCWRSWCVLGTNLDEDGAR